MICKKILIYLKIDKVKQTFSDIRVMGKPLKRYMENG